MGNGKGIDISDMFVDISHQHLRYRRTKIIATIGPSTSSEEMITKLIKNGLNVARINFSHGDPEDHLKVISMIRNMSSKLGMPVAILGDLCGPKVRVGRFINDSIKLNDNSKVFITAENIEGHDNIIPSMYHGIINESKSGDRILLDDGNLELKVLGKNEGAIEATVVRGGILKNNKGMNLPDTKMNISALTEKDMNDVRYCILGDVDYIALSFVRHSEDVKELKEYLHEMNSSIPVIAKIEKPEALNNIEKIIEISDGIMIARGDLGVEISPEKVPLIQIKLIQLVNSHNKPVIVATQMLESMIEHSRPTRAEATDVSAACLDGADAVMLSAETAVGKYPVEAVMAMDSILRETETYRYFSNNGGFKLNENLNKKIIQKVVSDATTLISQNLKVNSIMLYTKSGYTAEIIASDRPSAPIIALTESIRVMNRLSLIWGVYPFLMGKIENEREFLERGEEIIKEQGIAKVGEYIIILSHHDDNNHFCNNILIRQIT
ncbi:MAG: pyruvate kinase [Bacteroidota bacterium]|nr:pyruvate kinase [Bacteroidota bacterium]